MNSESNLSQSPAAAGMDHRYRLIRGLAHCIAEQGYAVTTVSDIVAAAAVSKRTFYEHFDAKAACLIALYESASLEGLRILSEQIDPQRPWQDQLANALNAYFDWISSDPALMRTLLIDILALGSEGLGARRKVNNEIGRFIVTTVYGPGGELATDAKARASALVGAIHELLLERCERSDRPELSGMASLCTELTRRILLP